MNREKQKLEAIERLKILNTQGLMNEALKAFQDDGTVFFSEPTALIFHEEESTKKVRIARLGRVKDNPELMEVIKAFEEKPNGGLVYHISESLTEFGKLYSLFYVSKQTDEWASDREDLKEFRSCVYVENADYEPYSEFGYIGYALRGGGVLRIS